MKKSVLILLLAAALTICTARIPVTAATERAELWIRDGYSREWCGRDINGDGLVNSLDFALAFPDDAESRAGAQEVTQSHPIVCGVNNYTGIYILDDTPLYFGNVTVNGGLIGFSDVVIASGTLSVTELISAGRLMIGEECGIEVSGDIHAAGQLSCNGGIATVFGDVEAAAIWLTSEKAPLVLAVEGDVRCGIYSQLGGSVTVLGGITADYNGKQQAGGQALTVSADGAVFGDTRLDVRGGIDAVQGAVIGGSIYSAGLDEASLHAFLTVRGGGLTSPAAESGSVTVTAGGGLTAQYIEMYCGELSLAESLTVTQGKTEVRGGKIAAHGIISAGDIILGSADDYYGTNEGISVILRDKATCGGDYICHSGLLVTG